MGRSDLRNDSDAAPTDVQRDEVLREWRESASYWQKHIGTLRTMFGPVTQALIEDASIVEGYSVLDVAGGSGEPALTIAEAVGPDGLVTCTDAVAEMVAAAQIEAQRRGLKNVAFQQCAADSLPFDSDSFDAVVSRLGVMFFPNPLAALREMLRVTKGGGAVSLAVWASSELNPFSCVITNVVARYFDATTAEPKVPGAFRFAEPGALAQLLKDAGAIDVKERVLKFHIAGPVSPKQFWEMRSEMSGTLREQIGTLSPPQVNLIAQEVQQAVREFFPNDQMRFPAQMIIVTGKKPKDSATL
jgi:ubiquinone/menaquinone biosynthesis C-methylase UbiE